MRLKPTAIWLALAVLVMVALVLRKRPHDRVDPLVAGRPLSHWLEVIENRQTANRTDYMAAASALLENTNKAALQSQILDRIEVSYSVPARIWNQIYFSLPPRLRSPLPEPRFGRIEVDTVLRLIGTTTEPSARQRAAIQMMLGDDTLNTSGTSAALLVALSPSTQTVPEAIALLRRQLAVANPGRRLKVCVAIHDKINFESWRAYRETTAGLLADLKLVATSDIDPDARVEARKALDHLNSELGGLTFAGKGPDTKFESTLSQPNLFAAPVQLADRPLTVDAPGSASELNLHLSSPAPPAGTDPFKP